MRLNTLSDDMMPIVSVCIQTYQHSAYIEQCLLGALEQETNFSYEIIVGEDCSSDGTREICIKYSKLHPDKIKLFLRDRKDVIYINNKPTGRYNLIQNLKAARGKYIALLEGDDYWVDSLKLQKQVDFLESNLNYSICGTRAYSLRGTDFGEMFEEKTFGSREIIFGPRPLQTASMLFRNNIILPSWIMSAPVGDTPLLLLCLRAGKGYVMKDLTHVYRIHETGFWNRRSSEEQIQSIINTRSFLKEHMPELKDEFDEVIYNLKKNNFLYSYSIISIFSGETPFSALLYYVRFRLRFRRRLESVYRYLFKQTD